MAFTSNASVANVQTSANCHTNQLDFHSIFLFEPLAVVLVSLCFSIERNFICYQLANEAREMDSGIHCIDIFLLFFIFSLLPFSSSSCKRWFFISNWCLLLSRRTFTLLVDCSWKIRLHLIGLDFARTQFQAQQMIVYGFSRR